MIIREATAHDIPAITHVAQSSFIDAFTEYTDPDVLADDIRENRSEDYFEKVITEDTILVVDINSEIVAYIQFGNINHTYIETNSDDIELRRLYVLTDHHRNGYGSQLIDAMLKHARLDNMKRIFLNVWDINTSAIALYERYGFTNTGIPYPYFFEGKEVGHDDIYVKILE